MDRLHAELRAEVQGDRLAGHAAVFGPMAAVRGGWERLAPSAFDAALERGDDVRALVNHDPGQLLGRTAAGTLRLSTDTTGLQFEVDLPNTTYARDLRELVSRGDLTGASFGFVPGAWDTGTAPDGKQLRTHTEVAGLFDVSAVTFPAYDDTDVTLRYQQFPADWRAENLRLLARRRAMKERARNGYDR